MVITRSLALSICFIGLLGRSAGACTWDSDTLEQERSRYPTTLELITGKFLRHTREFYEWRIQDRLRRLKDQPYNAALADDLAVAYEKTEQHDKAIAVMLDVEERTPGRYETAANLGTFYIHSGRFEEGLKQIERAIKINPNAHFGREIYQKLLVEYVLECRKDGKIPIPLSTAPEERGARGFALYIWRRKCHEQSQAGSHQFDTAENFNAEMNRAVTGILGMMRFGQHDSPLLLEALGDLLDASYSEATDRDANLLAARAYLKASLGAKTQAARTAFKTLAAVSLGSQHIETTPQLDNTMPKLESVQIVEIQLKHEIREAEEWYSHVRNNELAWIREGRNVDFEFTRTFYAEPQIASSKPPVVPWSSPAAYLGQLSAETFSSLYWEQYAISPTWLCGWLLLAVLSLAILRSRRRTTRETFLESNRSPISPATRKGS